MQFKANRLIVDFSITVQIIPGVTAPPRRATVSRSDWQHPKVCSSGVLKNFSDWPMPVLNA